MTTATANPYSAPNAEMGGEDETYQPQVFSFSGRIGRLRYIAYSMAWGLVLLCIGLVVLGGGALMMGGFEGVMAGLGFGLFAIYGILAQVPSFIVAIRRANDMDQSGWLSLLLLVPFVNFIFILVLLFAPGTKGSNKYGPEPVENSAGVIAVASIVIGFFALAILLAIFLPAFVPSAQGL